ncbi:unnamed protein product [Effrenium voratum]|nr:unnamed protein product [Effrenium voratum]
MRGRILHINRDGTFGIQIRPWRAATFPFDTGDVEYNVPALNIRAADIPAAPMGWRAAREVKEVKEDVPPPPPPPPQRGVQPAGPKWPSDSPAPRPKAVAPPNPDRTNEAKESPGGELLDPSAVPPYRLWCVYAEGLDLAKLSTQQRALSSSAPELVLGRTAQAEEVWKTLVPDRRLHGTVSREHLKVLARPCPGKPLQAMFSVVCLSLNGALLNHQFISNGCGEQPLQHGDVLALATSVEVAGQDSRKPFVVFQFEVLGPSPAVMALPTAYGTAQAPPAAQAAPAAQGPAQGTQRGPFDDLEETINQKELQVPAGMVAGRWRSSASVAAPEALYCLEVHGNELRPGLPAEARQLFYCSEPATEVPGVSLQAWPCAPGLRVGRYYQRGGALQLGNFHTDHCLRDLEVFFEPKAGLKARREAA